MVLLALATLGGSASAEHGTPGTTQLISRPSGTGPVPPGLVNSSYSGVDSISADNRYVVFASSADGISQVDDNRFENIFVRDLQTGAVTLVSRASGANGAPAHAHSYHPTISSDGKRVAFTSDATLDPADTNTHADIYVRDLTTNTTILVSRGGPGDAVGDNVSYRPSSDATGNRIAFESDATNFVAGASTRHIYVRDIGAATTTLVSRAAGAGGELGDNSSAFCSISDDGKKVVFQSYAANLIGVGNDMNNTSDIFLRNVDANTIQMVSGSDGVSSTIGNGYASDPSISGDGTKVAFVSDSTNLVGPGADTNGLSDVFVRDLVGHTTTRVSVSNSSNAQANGRSNAPGLSADGNVVVFESAATNLAAADANGTQDVFVRVPAASSTLLVSRSTGAAGAISNARSDIGSISADASRVVFESVATNLGENNGADFDQVRMRNLSTQTTSLVSRPAGNGPWVGGLSSSSLNDSLRKSISADGRYVVFTSSSDSMSSTDDDTRQSLFLRDTLTDTTTQVDVGLGGAPPNGYSTGFTISADGSTVAYESDSSNIVAGDTNNTVDIFVRTLGTGATVRVGGAPHGTSQAVLSADGSKLAFTTQNQLVTGDTNGQYDVYVRDLRNGATTLVSRATGTNGAVGLAESSDPSISADGTKVAFYSGSEFETGAALQMYVRDLKAGTTVLASRGDGVAGTLANNLSAGVISGDGRSVAFYTYATNLVSPDTNGMRADIFVRNLVTKRTSLVDVSTAGQQANDDAVFPSISGDGKRIAFESAATNLGSPTGGLRQVFVRDMAAGTTTIASSGPAGIGNSDSDYPMISENGDCVAFQSVAGNLTPSWPRSDYSAVLMRTVSRECPAAAPETTIVLGPAKRSAKRRPVLTFSANEAATFACRLDGGGFAACVSPFNSPRLADGLHTFQVRATDLAGYVDATPATQTWTVDATGPRIRITVPKQRLASVRKRGLRVIVRADEACVVGSRLFVGRKAAGKGATKLRRAGKRAFFVKLTKRQRRALSHRRRVRFTLKTSAKDTLGNKSLVKVNRVRLRR